MCPSLVQADLTGVTDDPWKIICIRCCIWPYGPRSEVSYIRCGMSDGTLRQQGIPIPYSFSPPIIRLAPNNVGNLSPLTS